MKTALKTIWAFVASIGIALAGYICFIVLMPVTIILGVVMMIRSKRASPWYEIMALPLELGIYYSTEYFKKQTRGIEI